MRMRMRWQVMSEGEARIGSVVVLNGSLVK